MVGRWYVAEKNPCQNVERNPSKRRTRYVTDEEYAIFYHLASPRLQITMDLALITGQRQGDLLTLKWASVKDFGRLQDGSEDPRNGISFRQGKTGKKLLVGLSDALRDVLARARFMVPVVDIGGYVIRTRRGTPYSSDGFRACWQVVMKKAMKRGLLQERFTFHDLRAKSVSDSKNIQEAFERAGHTSMAMTRGTYDRAERKVTPLK
jgi:integrase